MTASKESLKQALSAEGVSRETVRRFEIFAELFSKWSTAINLVAPSTVGELYERHIFDSLQIYKLAPGPNQWLDLGSGGGFPGIVTAICLAELREGWVHLVESNNKKAAFLRLALHETGARGTVYPLRIEKAPDVIAKVSHVSARALADLNLLFGYIEPWAIREPKLKAFLHKGRDYRLELEVSHRRWNFDLIKHQSVVEEDSVVLEISALERKSDFGEI